MSSCLIQLDNFQGLYCAGNVIAGRVICSLNKNKSIGGWATSNASVASDQTADVTETCLAIKLKLEGLERNSWTGTESYYDRIRKRQRTRTTSFIGHNTFVCNDIVLHGGGNLGPGRFEFPFTFQLPSNVPGSYQGHYGGIFYTLTAQVDRSLNVKYTDTIQIIVASLIDFNHMRGLIQLEPVAYSVDKTICCCCCASGPITMAVHLEKEAFVVGEVANIRVDICNMSNENIEGLNIKLSMKIKSMVTYPNPDCKYDSVILATQSDTGVGAHGERTYNIALKILDTIQVPNFSICQLFSQKTKLTITAVISRVHSNLEVETYVTMGHVPILGSSQNPGQYLPSTHPPNMYPPNSYPTIREGISSPPGCAAQQEAGNGPSAPPSEGGPSKNEMGGNELPVQASDDPWSPESPPPSYSEAVPYATKQ